MASNFYRVKRADGHFVMSGSKSNPSPKLWSNPIYAEKVADRIEGVVVAPGEGE